MALMQLGQDAQTGPVAATMAQSLQSTLQVEIVPSLTMAMILATKAVIRRAMD